MKIRISFIILIMCSLYPTVVAQVAMGKWRTHFAYNNVSQITQSANKIFAVSEGALFSVDKQDGGMEFYSKLSGLNGSDISRIEFDSTNSQLIIIYSNGNIDVMTAGGITNISDLYIKQMSSKKDVNQIQFFNNKAYLACSFGIVIINTAKKEVSDTYFIGPNASEVNVLNTTIFDNNIYALSASTVYKASITDPHLVNYEFWSTVNNLPGSGDNKSISSFGGKLILLRGNKLWKQDDNNWNQFLTTVNAVDSFTISNGTLSAFSSNNVYLIDNQFNATTLSNTGKISDAEFDRENSTYYFAANAAGIKSYKIENGIVTSTDSIKPVGPAVNMPWDMTFSGQKLFVVPGGRWATTYNRNGAVMMYENKKWTNILAKQIQDSTKLRPTDFMDVAVDPTDNTHFFVTSMGTGLYEFKNNVFFKWHNTTNSFIESIIPSAPNYYMNLCSSIMDKDGNLWFTNNGGPGGEIKILLKDGTWKQMFFSGSRPTPGKLMISNQNPNQKWLPSQRYSPGILIFDDNGTFDTHTFKYYQSFTFPETDDNGTKLVTISPSNVYNCVQDKNGVVWVGTDLGPFLFTNLSKVFEDGYTCSRVKIPRGDSTNLADYLLVNENIQAIAIDGANRKWLGTKTSGLYLMSENGQQTIHQFTTLNSPLLSNNIMSLAINPVTGEVFIGTDKGLVSYQSDASEAGSSFGNVYAYPNPVRQGYNGVITITGLVENTHVKITDINGNLVCETVSNGSLATWDGKNNHGRKVSTGVYLAICASPDGVQSNITKILVIN